jgi:hypothetical protein
MVSARRLNVQTFLNLRRDAIVKRFCFGSMKYERGLWLKGVLGVNYAYYGRKRFLQRKAGNENGYLFVSEMPSIKRIPDPVDEALEEEGLAPRRERSRPGQVRQSPRLHGSHRRYALLPQPALPSQI